MAKEMQDAQNEVLKGVTDHEDEPLGGADDDLSGGNEGEFDPDNNNGDIGDDADDEEGNDGVLEDDDEDPKPRSKKGPDDDEDEPRRKSTEPVDDDDEQTMFKYAADNRGNILDVDGKILFPAGRARNEWAKLKKAWMNGRDRNAALVAHATKISDAGRELWNRYQQLKETANPGAKKGLTEAENNEAVEMMAMMKIDPKQAVRAILTKVHLSGIDLKDLGITGPVDAREVARFQHEMAEAAREKRIKERQDTAKESARKEASDFLINNADAAPYLGMITKAKYDFPHMTLPQIWTQLKRAARAEAEKRKNGNRGRDNNRRRDGEIDREPPPRNGSRNNRPAGTKLSNKAVDPSMSFKQIGRQLLDDIQKMERG